VSAYQLSISVTVEVKFKKFSILIMARKELRIEYEA
jgi:hypothetical protein